MYYVVICNNGCVIRQTRPNKHVQLGGHIRVPAVDKGGRARHQPHRRRHRHHTRHRLQPIQRQTGRGQVRLNQLHRGTYI